MNNCKFHGFDKLGCPGCKQAAKDDFFKMISTGQAVVGVFAWTGKNDYSIEKAVKTFKRKVYAERYAENLNKDPLKIHAEGYVTRLVYVKAGSK